MEIGKDWKGWSFPQASEQRKDQYSEGFSHTPQSRPNKATQCNNHFTKSLLHISLLSVLIKPQCTKFLTVIYIKKFWFSDVFLIVLAWHVQILGTGMSAKMWEVTVEHAKKCVLDSRRYLYFPSDSQNKTGIVFNAVGQLTGILSEGQYVTLDKLSEAEKVLLSLLS